MRLHSPPCSPASAEITQTGNQSHPSAGFGRQPLSLVTESRGVSIGSPGLRTGRAAAISARPFGMRRAGARGCGEATIWGALQPSPFDASAVA
jgi:hypothetical protein